MSDQYESQTFDKIRHKAARLFPLDALRGLVIVLMALDHANHFVAQRHSAGEYWGGPFPVYPDPLSFLTRFITHLAAPAFFVLMGAGMLLFAHSRRKAGWNTWAVTWHFLVRGGLLIGMQLLVINRAWELSTGGWALQVYVGVLFALGGAMILTSPLVWLKPKYLLALTVVLLLATEWLAPSPGMWRQVFTPIIRLLLIPGGNLRLWVNYPVLPWLELVTFGMIFGYWLLDDPRKAFDRGLKLGGVLLLGFLLLRYLDGFGNIRPREGIAWVDFFNLVKYPPSVTFTLLMMGINLILLGLMDRAGEKTRRFLQPLVVFGQVPLFVYVTHFFLYAGLGLLLTPGGTSIPEMYLYWLLGLLILYPLCLWYGRLKHRQPANSVLRFL